VDARFHSAISAIKSSDIDRLRALVRLDRTLATSRSSTSHPTLLQCLVLDARDTPNQIEMARILIDAGAEINGPLYACASCNNVAAATLLLDCGAAINGSGSWSPLEEALYWNSQGVIDLLVQRGASTRNLRIAAGLGRTDVMEIFFAADGSLRPDPNNVLTMRVRLVQARYPTPGQRSAFFAAALPRIRALPGVTAAGTVDTLPFAAGSGQPLLLEGYPPQRRTVPVRQVLPGYLRAMGIPVLRGRDIVESDAEVLLVSQEAAKLYWGNDDPIGRRAILPALSRTVLRQVVGIVGDVKQRNLIEGSTPTVYLYTREPNPGVTFAIRTTVPPAMLAQPAVAAIRAIDPEQPVQDIRTMGQVLDGQLIPQRFSALLLGVFAGVALLLAAVGIYSVLSYIVRGRSREIGIRTALGARTSDVLRLVIVEGMSPALVGIAVGMIAALTSAKVMATLVFGVSASDPLTLAAVAAMLAFVALMASLVPAYRALRLDPVKVLRAD
jgi:predicted permease